MSPKRKSSRASNKASYVTVQELERLAEEQYNGNPSSDTNTSINNKASQAQTSVAQVQMQVPTPSPSPGNGTSPRRKPAPCTVGRQPYCPALAAQLFANTLFTLARLKFMRMGSRLPHALIWRRRLNVNHRTRPIITSTCVTYQAGPRTERVQTSSNALDAYSSYLSTIIYLLILDIIVYFCCTISDFSKILPPNHCEVGWIVVYIYWLIFFFGIY